MKKRLLFISSVITLAIASSAFIIKHSTGIAGFAGSPGENTCSNCHLVATSVSGTSIVATPAFTGNQYVPGQTYTIQIGVGSLTLNKFGFACEILNSSSFTNAGVMQNPQAGIQFSVAANARKSATHTTPKSGAGFATFQFEWVAPNAGNVNIYAAGNAVNSNSLSTGDGPSTASLALTPAPASVKESISMFSSVNIFPNPIKSEFKFNYSLIESGMVRVALFDLQGKEVAEFINENQLNGVHTVNASLPGDINKGVYIMKFSLNGKQTTQRMIITQ